MSYIPTLFLIDHYIPTKVIDRQTEALTKTRVFIGILLSSIAFMFSLIASSLIVGIYLNSPAMLLGCLCILPLLCSMTSLNLYKFGGSFAASSNLHAFSMYVLILGAIAVTGGYLNSPAIHLSLIIPCFLFFIAEISCGVSWSFIILATIIGLSVLETTGLSFSYSIADKPNTADIFIATLLCIFALLSCFLYYSHNTHKNNATISRYSTKLHGIDLDKSTLLPNHNACISSLKRCLENAILTDQVIALAAINVNTTNAAISRVSEKHMIRASQMIMDRLTNEYITYRIKKNGFALLFNNIKSVESVTKLLHELQRDISLIDTHIYPYIGLSFYPHHTDDAETLLNMASKAADIANIKSKELEAYENHASLQPRLQIAEREYLNSVPSKSFNHETIL